MRSFSAATPNRPKRASRQSKRRPAPGRQTAKGKGNGRRDALVQARAEAERAIAEARTSHARLREAIDILPQGIVFLDSEGRYILWNQQYADIYKGSSDLFEVGRRLEETLRIGVERGNYPEAIGREDAWIAERLAMLHTSHHRHEQWLADGRCILIDERQTADGGSIGLRVDITDIKAREASFRLLFDANPVPMFLCASDGHDLLAANDAAIEHYGYTRAQVLGMTLASISAPGNPLLFELDGSGPLGANGQHRKADGSLIDVAVFSRTLIHDGIPAVLIAAIDITERKRAEARVIHLAHHDMLTGLPNRVLLRARMEEALGHMRRSGDGAAVLCIDLDNFKSVNDTLGHSAGDLLLQEVAARLRSVLRADDTPARLGGDEFAVLIAGVARPENAGALAETLVDMIGRPFDINGHQVLIGASIGIAAAPGDGTDADALLKNADMALYRAKSEGKGTFRFFEAGMDARVQARRRLEIDLRKTVMAGELQVHYQPLVDLTSGQISGMEALVRWPHPERGFIAPAEFVPVAEETGLIGQLGAFVLKRACRDAMTWPAHVNLAVNLSPVQFRVGDVYASVSEALRASGLPPVRLQLEITEAVMLEKVEHVLATLHALRELGVKIAMDDFGTGYSSLSYLSSFPFDKIKIDRMFVRNLATNANSQAIVRAILSLGASFGITITAEGIETEAELACLKERGCSEGQGYLFGSAQPNTEARELFNLVPGREAA